jgi:simple sugar transport system permease protein
LIGVSPAEALRLILHGAFGSPDKLAYLFTAWVPLLLCSAAVLITFSAGFWNIGIEGQVVMGAVAATGLMRLTQDALPPWVVLALAALTGMVGGALWGLLAGALKSYGCVNEIFGGLGLNFVAGSLTVYLVLGPWKRPGVASTGGTEPFPPSLWLPTFGDLPVSPIELLLGLAGMVAAAFLLRGTYLGLRFRAIGKNPTSAGRLGVPIARYTILAFLICGAIAGLVGWILVAGAGARHNLFPLISSGYGFLGLLTALLAGFGAGWCAAVSWFFAVIMMGSLELSMQRQLDSSLGGVIQGLLALSVLAAQGARDRLLRRRED